MKIGFDLDKVFINYPPFISANLIEKLYKKNTNKKLEYRIPNKYERFIRIASHYHILRPPLKNNLDLLKKLTKNKKHQYYLISSRFSFLENKTNTIVKKYNLDKYFKSLNFNYKNIQPHIFKDQKIKELGINMYIDDDLALLKYLADKNKKVKFYWLNNKSDKKLSGNLYAVTSLNKVFPN